MPTLAETQLHLRHAVVARDAAGILPLLNGGRNPSKRLAVHQRHYETSLTNALLGKFPATCWLVGIPFLTEAARRYIQIHPPHAPCIAEYGKDFPIFLATRPGAERVPYLEWFSEVEWHLGHVAIAIDRAALRLDDLSAADAGALADATLTVQPGVRFTNAPWPIDDLIQLYLTGKAPDEFRLTPTEVWLEIRGARGEFQINRLDPTEYTFRKAIHDGQTIGIAAELALGSDSTFDPGRSFAKLMTDGLVIAINQSN